MTAFGFSRNRIEEVHFHIDQPASDIREPVESVEVRGWCFDKQGRPAKELFIRMGRIRLPMNRVERPDVAFYWKDSYPGLSEGTGFECRVQGWPGGRCIQVMARFQDLGEVKLRQFRLQFEGEAVEDESFSRFLALAWLRLRFRWWNGVCAPSERLRRSGFFDADYYGRQVPELAGRDEREHIRHFLEEGCTRGISANALFHPAFYGKAYPEVERVGCNPLLHYLLEGRRRGYRPSPRFSSRTARAWSKLVRTSQPKWRDPVLQELQDRHPVAQPFSQDWKREFCCEYLGQSNVSPAEVRVRVLCARNGNFFFRELAEDFSAFFRAAGIQSELICLDTWPEAGGDKVVTFVMAPHEQWHFARQGPPESLKRELVLFNTEQPGSWWFEQTLGLAGGSMPMLDINPQTAWLWRQRGLSAYWVPFPLKALSPEPPFVMDVPFLEGLPERARGPAPGLWRNRPIDFVFLGTETSRRSSFFGRHAAALHRHPHVICMPSAQVPITASATYSVQGPAASALCRRSRVLLNIHRAELPYAEWHRLVLLGLSNGCALVTESVPPLPFLQSGLHFFQAPLDEIPALLDDLLLSKDGRQRLEESVEKSRNVLESGLRPGDWMPALLKSCLERRT